MTHFTAPTEQIRAAYRALIERWTSEGYDGPPNTAEGRAVVDPTLSDQEWAELAWDQLAVRELAFEAGATGAEAYAATRLRAALTGEPPLFP